MLINAIEDKICGVLFKCKLNGFKDVIASYFDERERPMSKCYWPRYSNSPLAIKGCFSKRLNLKKKVNVSGIQVIRFIDGEIKTEKNSRKEWNIRENRWRKRIRIKNRRKGDVRGTHKYFERGTLKYLMRSSTINAPLLTCIAVFFVLFILTLRLFIWPGS